MVSGVFAVVLGVSAWAISGWTGVPVLGVPDAPTWLAAFTVLAATAAVLAVLLKVRVEHWSSNLLAGVPIAAVAVYLAAGASLYTLGSGDPLKGPRFLLEQFAHPTIYLVLVFSFLAAVLFGWVQLHGERDRR